MNLHAASYRVSEEEIPVIKDPGFTPIASYGE